MNTSYPPPKKSLGGNLMKQLTKAVGVILSIVAGDKEIKSKIRGLFRKGVA